MKKFLLYLLFLFLLGNHCPPPGPAFRSKPVPLGDFFQDYWLEIDHFYWSVNHIEVMKGKLYIADYNTVYTLDSIGNIVIKIDKSIKNFEVSPINPNWLLILDENSMLYLSKNGQSADSLGGGIKSYGFSPFDTLIFYFTTQDSLKISYDGGVSSQLLLAKRRIKDFKPDPYDPASLYLLSDSFGINYLSISNDSGKTWHSTATPEYLDFILVDSNKVYGLSSDRTKIWECDKMFQTWTKLRQDYYLAVDIAKKGLISVFIIAELAECWKLENGNWQDITIGINTPGRITDDDLKLTCEGNDYYMYFHAHRGGTFLYHFHDTDKTP